MVRCYITTEQEINAAKQRLSELRQHAILCRDAGDEESSAVFYNKANGFKECLEMLGTFSKNNINIYRRATYDRSKVERRVR